MTNHGGNQKPIGKPTDPQDRMGVYKRLKDVPENYRLSNPRRSRRFAGRDVWGEFMAEQFERYESDRFRQNTKRVGRRWKKHMNDIGRHHALAKPEDVEAFMAAALHRWKMDTVYLPYWTKIEKFYSWLQWSTEHPHRYHPVLMAAAEYPASGKVWDHKVNRHKEE